MIPCQASRTAAAGRCGCGEGGRAAGEGRRDDLRRDESGGARVGPSVKSRVAQALMRARIRCPSSPWGFRGRRAEPGIGSGSQHGLCSGRQVCAYKYADSGSLVLRRVTRREMTVAAAAPWVMPLLSVHRSSIRLRRCPQLALSTLVSTQASSYGRTWDPCNMHKMCLSTVMPFRNTRTFVRLAWLL